MAEPKRVPNSRLDSGKAANDSQYNSPEARRKEFSVVGGKNPLPTNGKKEEKSEQEKTLLSINERIKSSDRSHLNQPFFEKSSTSRVGRVTVDEQFAGEYSKRGLRPSYESVDPRIKNVRVREKYAEKAEVQDQEVTQIQPGQPQVIPSQRTRQVKAGVVQAPKKKKSSRASRRLARAKASAINTSLLSWNIPLWFFFQLPVAVLNLAFFGLAHVYLEIFGFDEEARTGSVRARNEDTGAWEVVTGYIMEGVRGFFNTLNELIIRATGFDFLSFFNALNPVNLFMMTLMLLMAYGLIILTVVGLMYMLAGLRPLSGKGGGLKVGAFLMCIVGYTFPILNLFPWIFLWTAAVWANPK